VDHLRRKEPLDLQPKFRNATNERAIRYNYSQVLKQASPEFVLEMARGLLKYHKQCRLAYDLIADHRPAFQRIGETEVEELGQGIDSDGRNERLLVSAADIEAMQPTDPGVILNSLDMFSPNSEVDEKERLGRFAYSDNRS
jgi:hypothetical protein